MWLRMQAKSAAGRERAVENIIGEVGLFRPCNMGALTSLGLH